MHRRYSAARSCMGLEGRTGFWKHDELHLVRVRKLCSLSVGG